MPCGDAAVLGHLDTLMAAVATDTVHEFVDGAARSLLGFWANRASVAISAPVTCSRRS